MVDWFLVFTGAVAGWIFAAAIIRLIENRHNKKIREAMAKADYFFPSLEEVNYFNWPVRTTIVRTQHGYYVFMPEDVELHND